MKLMEAFNDKESCNYQKLSVSVLFEKMPIIYFSYMKLYNKHFFEKN